VSIKEAPYYWVVCDDCGVRSTEEGEYAAWGDVGSAYDEATNAFWAIDIEGKDYCESCSPYPMCAGCGEKTARTEFEDDTWCDECIVEEVQDDEDAAAT